MNKHEQVNITQGPKTIAKFCLLLDVLILVSGMSTMTTGTFEITKRCNVNIRFNAYLFRSYDRNYFNRNVIFTVLIVVIAVQAVKLKNYSKFVPVKMCIS